MGNERADDQPEHDPYARRPGYVTNASGRTDQVTTAAAFGVGAGLVTSFVLGFFHAVEWVSWSASVLVGVVVWLLLRARQRRLDRREGRSPDAVAHARDRAIAEANGGRRFFVAPNPVVVIVMGGIFLALGLLSLVLGDLSVHRVVVSTVLVACAAFFIVQGIGTLVVRRRSDPTRMR
ncbi:hypothetical protein [Curtobacterium pusillum]|uniref:hypothetical protein n=1 Tax=Curtobacterium pusillum TaxID=69373 RepID=UPI00119FA045|nr:hypothetical protein [Curtobacterium pusillum]